VARRIVFELHGRAWCLKESKRRPTIGPAEIGNLVELLKETEDRPDLRLVEKCQDGDAAAFDELVHRYKNRVYNVAYRFLGNHEDAQDVAQETFIRAYKGIQSFKGAAKVSTWLHSIAGNLAKNRLRDSHRREGNKETSIKALAEKPAHDPFADDGPAPDEMAQKSELDDALQRCLGELPEHYRMAFVLRTFDGLTYEEIADTMDCPLGTVKSRLNQARTLLRDRLKELALI
jgi:RNA polymerase sigma-70 factor (ECF subfamily)